MKLIPTCFQNINQNLMLFPNVKRSTVIYDLAIFGLKVPYFGQVPLEHQILLCNYSDRADDKIPMRFWCYYSISEKTRCHFGPRLLYFGYSLYLLALDLSLAIQFQNYTRLSLQILADTIPPVLPVLTLEYQCHQKDYHLPDYIWTITDYFGSFIQPSPKDYGSQIPVQTIGHENTSFCQNHVVNFC